MTLPEAGRLARAVHLTVEEIGAGLWGVEGGAERHVVARTPQGALRCYCRDVRAGGRCKHLLAVALAGLDADVRAGLRVLVALPKRPKRKSRAR